MDSWISLITTLPTENATVRMRVWRALKAAGAVVLRDGVYVLPDRADCRTTLESIANDVAVASGTAFMLDVQPADGSEFAPLFDRSSDYAELLHDIGNAHAELGPENTAETLKQTRKLRKTLAGIIAIDFFPGEARRQAEAALQELEVAAARTLSPDEPQPVESAIPALDAADYRGRIWATRRRPWVDRLASAWLIRRCIDPDARIVWLATPADCPPEALGFDFDGAAFSHVGARVTFEVLLAAFGLATPALARVAALVHFLDVGGVQPPEAGGVESVLAGLRDTLTDDDRLLETASAVFDALLATYEKTNP